VFRKLPFIIFLLHAYVAWRLLPDMPGALGYAATALWLVASAIATPLWPIARRVTRQPLRDRLMGAGMLAIGAFSSLLVLTFFRDAALLASALFDAASVEAGLRRQGALAVPILAALATITGYINARRRAGIRRVDIPIAGLPAALHGFSIAQISDLHVGPTIKRDYLERVVDAVNGLDADVIAVTGDLVDGSVNDLAPHTEPCRALQPGMAPTSSLAITSTTRGPMPG
jgi:hypothetical protein